MPTNQRCQVVIIGGGIIGCSVAFHLARDGVSDIVLLEKEGLACGATGICPGGIRQQFEGESDCVLARRSVGFWNGLNDILDSDDAFEFERSGYLFLADSNDLLDRFKKNVSNQNRLGIPSQILSTDDIGQLVPALRVDSVAGGSFCAEDGFVEDCHGVTNLLAKRASQAGARIQYCAARCLSRQTLWTVETTGGPIECEHVVLAAGIDSVALASTAGASLPIRREVRRLLFTEPHDETLMPPLVVAPERSFAGKQLVYGVFYLGWLGEQESDDDLTFIENSLKAGATLLPVLEEIPAGRVIRGVYDSTPDYRPLLGGVEGLAGLHMAAGFSGHGFMLAPAIGEIISASVRGVETDLPISDFSVGRFSGESDGEGLVI